MGMSIDLAMNNLSGILTEATEDEDSVCYVTEDDAETLRVAISTMRKYQKIAEIVKEWGDSGLLQNQLYDKLHEVVEDREHEIYRDSWTADILDSWYGPTIEAITKADYEARLRADMVAMLTEIQVGIGEHINPSNHTDSYEDGWSEGAEWCIDYIQERIDALRGEEDV